MDFIGPEVPGIALPPEKGLRYYGLASSPSGVREFTSPSREGVPAGAVKVGVAPGSVADALGRRLRAVHELSRPESMERAGGVFHHSDGGRTHSGICLGRLSGGLMLLFMTTSLGWNRFARRITREEQAMTGFPSRRPTYLAPVLRDEDGVTWTGLDVPEHRTAALRAEFFRVDDLEEIRLL